MEENQKATQKKLTPKAKKEKVKEVHYHYYQHKKERFNFGRFVFGLLVMVAGLLLLAHLTGWLVLDWSGFNFNYLWPILIIIAGLSLLSRGGWLATLIAIFTTIFVLTVVGAIIIGRAGFSKLNNGFFAEPITQTKPITVAKEVGLQSAILEIKTGAGDLVLAGGPAEFAGLVSGEFQSSFADLRVNSSLRGGWQKVILQQTGNWTHFWSAKTNRLNLALSPDTPLDLYLNCGAATLNLNLNHILAGLVDIDAGASVINLTLGDQLKEAQIKIKAGASAVKINLPQELGVQLTLDAALSSKNLGDLRDTGHNLYQSDNYPQADKSVNIDLDLGVSTLEINRI